MNFEGYLRAVSRETDGYGLEFCPEIHQNFVLNPKKGPSFALTSPDVVAYSAEGWKDKPAGWWDKTAKNLER